VQNNPLFDNSSELFIQILVQLVYQH
jgi:hypothetical protein